MLEGKAFPVLGVGGGTLTLGGSWTRKSNSNENSCDLISRAGVEMRKEDFKIQKALASFIDKNVFLYAFFFYFFSGFPAFISTCYISVYVCVSTSATPSGKE